MTATIVNYFDVWGNKNDGWEVNNLCQENERLELTDLFTKEHILKELKRVGFLKKTVRQNMVIIEDLFPFYEISQRKDFMPVCRVEIDID